MPTYVPDNAKWFQKEIAFTSFVPQQHRGLAPRESSYPHPSEQDPPCARALAPDRVRYEGPRSIHAALDVMRRAHPWWVVALVAMATSGMSTNRGHQLCSTNSGTDKRDVVLNQLRGDLSSRPHQLRANACGNLWCQQSISDASKPSCTRRLRGGSYQEFDESLSDPSRSEEEEHDQLFREHEMRTREDQAREDLRALVDRNGTDFQRFLAYTIIGDDETPHSIDFAAGLRFFPGLEHLPQHPREALFDAKNDETSQSFQSIFDFMVKPENLPLFQEAVEESAADCYNKFFNATRIEEKKAQRREKLNELKKGMPGKKKLNFNWLSAPANELKMEQWVQLKHWQMRKRARLALQQYHNGSPSVLFNLTYVKEGGDEDEQLERFILSFFGLEESHEARRAARERYYGPPMRELDKNLLTATRDGDWRQVGFWIRRGADVHVRDMRLDCNWTALHHAAFLGFSYTSRTLVEYGADVDAREPFFLDTALHLAAGQGHTGCVKMLVSLGCPVDVTNKLGRTPLHEAAICGQTDTCAALLELGADVNFKYRGEMEMWGIYDAWTNTGATALHDAAERGYDATCKLLLQKGAHLHALDSCMCTPLARTELHMIMDDLMDVCYHTHKLLKGWDDGTLRDYKSEVERSPGEDELDKLLHVDAGSFSFNFEWRDALNYNNIALNAFERAKETDFYTL
eukprot:768461-Hanusia_phi.AAC.4